MGLPTVTIETIKEIGEIAQTNWDELFAKMAAVNPILYSFAYATHNLEDTNKTTMLGVLVACYAALEAEAQKKRHRRKRSVNAN